MRNLIMAKIKLYAAAAFAAIILIMIPVAVVGAIAENPIGFIGEMIFGEGDSDTISPAIEETYKNFISSDIGKECMEYIDGLCKEEDTLFPYKSYIIPAFLVADTKDKENPTLENTGMDKLLEIAYNVRQELKDSDNNEYIHELKTRTEFANLNQLTDSTIIMYITSLGGGSDGGTGVPTCTEDLIDIAQGDLYLNASNPFIGGGYRGQCTWWCWTRCMQLTGVNMPTCNARDWVARTTLPTGTEPRSRSVLAVWDNGEGRQHVIFIEDYSPNGVITYSEGNIGGDGTVEYTEEHYLELLRYGKMQEYEFYMNRISSYDNYMYIYTD